MSVTLDLNNQLCAENARLKAEVERLTKAGDAMADVCGWDCNDQSAADALVEAWNSAKKGGQP